MIDEQGPLIAAVLADGPLAGTTQHVPAVEGRPPKTVDLDAAGVRVRYVLGEWTQAGHSAHYSFLYEV